METNVEKTLLDELNELDLTKDQHLMSIRKNGECLGHINAKDGKIVCSGFIGEWECNNFVALVWALQGFDIHIDNFYF